MYLHLRVGIHAGTQTQYQDSVVSFYLGSIIDEQGGSDADVKARIGKARAVYLQLKNIWDSKQLSTNTESKTNNSNISESSMPV
ncbi:unnamed protein product [Schistosoma margrebowiei]|uniref:Uncharacterized protein n=1 Tax=Schistosoma margrebowiei TaxID=48269 RepID=A0A183L9L0_9TREM|nr:unnamed protein product [Schistosoma margrebowiei]